MFNVLIKIGNKEHKCALWIYILIGLCIFTIASWKVKRRNVGCDLLVVTWSSLLDGYQHFRGTVSFFREQWGNSVYMHLLHCTVSQPGYCTTQLLIPSVLTHDNMNSNNLYSGLVIDGLSRHWQTHTIWCSQWASWMLLLCLCVTCCYWTVMLCQLWSLSVMHCWRYKHYVTLCHCLVVHDILRDCR